MFLRSESDFILATNISYDLQSLVTTYLKLFREYVNGFNGVKVPSHEFAVTFTPSKKEGYVSVVLHWTDSRTHTETLYYDTDSDYFSEQWGADNSCGSTSYSVEYPSHSGISIPINHLMMSEQDMINHFKTTKIKWEEDKAEAVRLLEIDRLRKELSKLENKGV